jgi:hypothetical protein
MSGVLSFANTTRHNVAVRVHALARLRLWRQMGILGTAACKASSRGPPRESHASGLKSNEIQCTRRFRVPLQKNNIELCLKIRRSSHSVHEDEGGPVSSLFLVHFLSVTGLVLNRPRR